MDKYLYQYNGPVMLFNDCIAHNWKGETYAFSEKKAKSNLCYQYKKQHGLTADAKITLPGKLVIK